MVKYRKTFNVLRFLIEPVLIFSILWLIVARAALVVEIKPIVFSTYCTAGIIFTCLCNSLFTTNDDYGDKISLDLFALVFCFVGFIICLGAAFNKDIISAIYTTILLVINIATYAITSFIACYGKMENFFKNYPKKLKIFGRYKASVTTFSRLTGIKEEKASKITFHFLPLVYLLVRMKAQKLDYKTMDQARYLQIYYSIKKV